MPIRIADSEGLWEIEVPVNTTTLMALRLQFARSLSDEGRLSYIRGQLGSRIVAVIGEVLDSDLLPPTLAQVNYAVAIARELSVNLPGEALQHRGAMKDFLDRYIPLFKARQGR